MKKSQLKYLEDVAKYIQSLGFEVEAVDPKHELLDVWGRINGKKCFVEIYLHAFSEDAHGKYGVWGQGENEDEELFQSHDQLYDFDLRFFPLNILDGLKPLKKRGVKNETNYYRPRKYDSRKF